MTPEAGLKEKKMAFKTDVKSYQLSGKNTCETPVKPGMWKLLVAAGAILVVLVVAISAVDHEQHAGFAMRSSQVSGKL